MAKLEAFWNKGLPVHAEMREWLEWKGSEFVEYDVEADPTALRPYAPACRRRTKQFRCSSRMARSCKSAGKGAAALWMRRSVPSSVFSSQC